MGNFRLPTIPCNYSLNRETVCFVLESYLKLNHSKYEKLQKIRVKQRRKEVTKDITSQRKSKNVSLLERPGVYAFANQCSEDELLLAYRALAYRRGDNCHESGHELTWQTALYLALFHPRNGMTVSKVLEHFLEYVTYHRPARALDAICALLSVDLMKEVEQACLVYESRRIGHGKQLITYDRINNTRTLDIVRSVLKILLNKSFSNNRNYYEALFSSSQLYVNSEPLEGLVDSVLPMHLELSAQLFGKENTQEFIDAMPLSIRKRLAVRFFMVGCLDSKKERTERRGILKEIVRTSFGQSAVLEYVRLNLHSSLPSQDEGICDSSGSEEELNVNTNANLELCLKLMCLLLDYNEYCSNKNVWNLISEVIMKMLQFYNRTDCASRISVIAESHANIWKNGLFSCSTNSIFGSSFAYFVLLKAFAEKTLPDTMQYFCDENETKRLIETLRSKTDNLSWHEHLPLSSYQLLASSTKRSKSITSTPKRFKSITSTPKRSKSITSTSKRSKSITSTPNSSKLSPSDLNVERKRSKRERSANVNYAASSDSEEIDEPVLSMYASSESEEWKPSDEE